MASFIKSLAGLSNWLNNTNDDEESFKSFVISKFKMRESDYNENVLLLIDELSDQISLLLGELEQQAENEELDIVAQQMYDQTFNRNNDEE